MNNRLNISPTATIGPQSYEEYIHPGCSISILIPSVFDETSVSSMSARLESPHESIELRCDDNNTKITPAGRPKSMTILDKRVIIYEQGSKMSFTVSHQLKKKNIQFTLGKDIFPLIMNTLEFTE